MSEARSVLFRQDDPADAGYVVISGSVALEREAEIPAPVRLMKGGSLIGLHALIVELERPATATAREKSSLLKLPRRLMLRVLEAFPDSAARLPAIRRREPRRTGECARAHRQFDRCRGGTLQAEGEQDRDVIRRTLEATCRGLDGDLLDASARAATTPRCDPGAAPDSRPSNPPPDSSTRYRRVRARECDDEQRRSTLRKDGCPRARSVSTGVWLTTSRSCLWFHTSLS